MAQHLSVNGKIISLQPDQPLAEALFLAGFPLERGCGGTGKCGKCQIELLSGTFISADKVLEITTPFRVKACCTRQISENGAVYLPYSSVEKRTAPAIALSEKVPPDQTFIALDAGTTNAAGMLVKNRKIIRFLEKNNAQTALGDNVIERIAFAAAPENRLLMEKHLREETLFPMLQELAAGEKIDQIIFSGNTVMTCFFFRADTAPLGVAPYRAPETGFYGTAGTLGIPGIAPETPVFAAPHVSGFIGGDVLSGLLAAGFGDPGCCQLFMDFGTNCEIVLNCRGRFFAAAAAAGPAFERGCGSIKSDHPVTHVNFSQNRWCFTPGTDTPCDFTASALADLLFHLYQANCIDRFGRWLDQPEIFARMPELSNKLFADIITAKAAIAASWQILLHRSGIHPEDIDSLILTGTFGSNLNTANAAGIGLIPDVPEEKIIRLPNGSLAGAALLSDPENRSRAEALKNRIKPLDLTADPAFAGSFANAMTLERKN